MAVQVSPSDEAVGERRCGELVESSKSLWVSEETGSDGRRENAASGLPDWADFGDDCTASSKAAGTETSWTLSASANTGYTDCGQMNGGSPQSLDWAQFSPSPSSTAAEGSCDSSQWAQSFVSTTDGAQQSTSSNTAGQSIGTEPEFDWQEFSHSGNDKTSSWPDEQSSGDPNAGPLHDKTMWSLPTAVCSSSLPQCPLHPPPTVVFRDCFCSPPHSPLPSRAEDFSSECLQGWEHLGDSSFASSLWSWAHTSLLHPSPSLCQERLLCALEVDSEALPTQQSAGSLTVLLGEDEGFDWSRPDQRRRSVSPEVVPNLFRPRKESLVEVDFDHDRAASGLAELSVEELQTMCEEMTAKFTRLSEELISNLQLRDVLAGEMEAKNRFVSALLRVQNLRHSQDTNGGDGARGVRQWAWSHRKREKKEEELSGMYLQTVIPYKLPEGSKWRVATLSQLTKVLKAIAEGSNTVPRLMSEYLQSEFLTSPVKRHSFEDSLSSSRRDELSTFSV